TDITGTGTTATGTEPVELHLEKPRRVRGFFLASTDQLRDAVRDRLVPGRVGVETVRGEPVRGAVEEVEGRHDGYVGAGKRGLREKRVPCAHDRGAHAALRPDVAEGIVEADDVDRRGRIELPDSGQDFPQVRDVGGPRGRDGVERRACGGGDARDRVGDVVAS